MFVRVSRHSASVEEGARSAAPSSAQALCAGHSGLAGTVGLWPRWRGGPDAAQPHPLSGPAVLFAAAPTPAPILALFCIDFILLSCSLFLPFTNLEIILLMK